MDLIGALLGVARQFMVPKPDCKGGRLQVFWWGFGVTSDYMPVGQQTDERDWTEIVVVPPCGANG